MFKIQFIISVIQDIETAHSHCIQRNHRKNDFVPIEGNPREVPVSLEAYVAIRGFKVIIQI